MASILVISLYRACTRERTQFLRLYARVRALTEREGENERGGGAEGKKAFRLGVVKQGTWEKKDQARSDSSRFFYLVRAECLL